MVADNYCPILLCILDGWGYSPLSKGNAVALAETPHWDRFLEENPYSFLQASETHVGLPAGQMGNSEVGHMNIGTGRVVMQDLPRINQVVARGQLHTNPAFKKLTMQLTESGGVCHLIGLISPGGVHSHQDHILALAQTLSAASIKVRLHAFLDGRDTPPRSAIEFFRKFEAGLDKLSDVRIVTVGGRYYGMDRDQRWDRVQHAYNAMVFGNYEGPASAIRAIEESYSAGISDEFLVPVAVEGYTGMKDGDGLLMANFRADRVRQMLSALVDPEFDHFERGACVRFVSRTGLTSYSNHLDSFVETMFPSVIHTDTLGEVISRKGITQLRIAETEKYAHVTFFLNGGREVTYPGEKRILVPSPKVATYDLDPEMSAREVAVRLIDAIRSEEFGFIVVNFANADMVGHTGNIQAAYKAVETIDSCLGAIAEVMDKKEGIMLITADHGNIEQMLDGESEGAHTAHTVNPVPLILRGVENVELLDGTLCDIAPTILELMRLPIPTSMSGRVLYRDRIKL